MTDPIASFLLAVFWPVIMAYAAYRIVIALGTNQNGPRTTERLVSAFGASITWWGRVIWDMRRVDQEWAFALTVVGIAIMFLPKLWGIFRQHRHWPESY